MADWRVKLPLYPFGYLRQSSASGAAQSTVPSAGHDVVSGFPDSSFGKMSQNIAALTSVSSLLFYRQKIDRFLDINLQFITDNMLEYVIEYYYYIITIPVVMCSLILFVPLSQIRLNSRAGLCYF